MPGFFIQLAASLRLDRHRLQAGAIQLLLGFDSSPALPYGPMRTRYTVLPLICADSTRAAQAHHRQLGLGGFGIAGGTEGAACRM
jgi:hypothetical protein